jgi:hypothetical protein
MIVYCLDTIGQNQIRNHSKNYAQSVAEVAKKYSVKPGGQRCLGCGNFDSRRPCAESTRSRCDRYRPRG